MDAALDKNFILSSSSSSIIDLASNSNPPKTCCDFDVECSRGMPFGLPNFVRGS
jgi:hypothetical protein